MFGPMKQQWRTILKQHKIVTRAPNITKEHFPSLIKQLWEKAVKPEHLQAGFRAVGLMPFNPQAVKPAQLVPSHAVVPTGEFTAVLTINNISETPMRAELHGYFWEVLRPASGQKDTETMKSRVLLYRGGADQ